MGNRLNLALLAAPIAVLLAVACSGPEPAEENPMGPNAACYVCHIPFVRESLSREHLAAKVYCINCHGLSADHANDEDIGATKPDIVFTREKINPACRACHATHDASPETVLARWHEAVKTRHAGKPPASPACTDCHGSHRIARPQTAPSSGS